MIKILFINILMLRQIYQEGKDQLSSNIFFLSKLTFIRPKYLSALKKLECKKTFKIAITGRNLNRSLEL